MFVTTADPVLEPPIITVNTVLSLLAIDYPIHKLACYVSDDGCSPLTFYFLVEASKFAKLWLPFCNKYNVHIRIYGLMTNASFMLNVDRDMFVNNPQVVHKAMCLLLGSKKDNDQCGFDQYPQVFYDGPADQEVILQEVSHDVLI
ncbi:hypothetical protein Ddye_016734 [Dipteronia dyeriana]|uniref:Cellulose synthase n=1 Tax=Dipteronia dyeriana TaxID=168575 RepID=A0AAD9X0U8_9ROSI|nr:hypothetical protein Ddye_016734 [Dipteronia dyeriana]